MPYSVMELFYASDIEGNSALLGKEESLHCIRVMRHMVGDIISVIDGRGSLLTCKITLCRRDETRLEILSREENFGGHSYNLEMAVAPTKNMERYEWFIEKATEIGVDAIVPIISARSERKNIKPERCEKLLLSAAKQSLKGAIPLLRGSCTVEEYILGCSRGRIRLIAYCGTEKGAVKYTMRQILDAFGEGGKEFSIMIGPEGDFSPQEVELALKEGFKPIHLGPSRLRTETAAVVVCCSLYDRFG